MIQYSNLGSTYAAYAHRGRSCDPRAIVGGVEGAEAGSSGYSRLPRSDDMLLLMRLEVIMLANSAKSNGWLLDIEGAGWEHYNCQSFPCRVNGALTGVVVLEDSDLGSDQQLYFKIENTNNEDIVFLTDNTYHVAGRGPAVAGVPSRVPFAVPFFFDAVAPAVMRAVVIKGDDDLGEVTFAIK